MAKAIMIQGTMSNAGKSVLVAGLCRIFAQDGYRVAPFKSQNMSLNSYVTLEGLEMGRAQVMQAEAAGTEPLAAMNPILLKPTGEMGSQVVVNGRVAGNMSAAEYFHYKKELRPVVQKAYERLADHFDIVVLEGAGSPAEINLKSVDMVNMGMARMAGAPVLLAGDIDLGGVFAQLYGTVQLLEPEERQLLKGMIINKFRGDVELLRPGLGPLEALCGAPVVGIVPYLELDLDDEDSLAHRLSRRGRGGALDIAVIRLPHLSNFTDFNPLERHPMVGLRYVSAAAELGRPDLLLLPGSKNTLGDLRWLWETGMARCILSLAEGGTPLIGICGGYQMLGKTLVDPRGVEAGGTAAGLGLLPVETTFASCKTRVRTAGRMQVHSGFFAPLCGVPLEGYEIHMGRTRGSCPPCCQLQEGEGTKPDGAVKGSVLGCYLHGLFDSSQLVEGLVSLLTQARGLPYEQQSPTAARDYRDRQYDLLAQGLRQSLELKQIYRILEAGI